MSTRVPIRPFSWCKSTSKKCDVQAPKEKVFHHVFHRQELTLP